MFTVNCSSNKLQDIESPMETLDLLQADDSTSQYLTFTVLSPNEALLSTFSKELDLRIENELPELNAIESFIRSTTGDDKMKDRLLWESMLDFAYSQWNDLVFLGRSKCSALELANRVFLLKGEVRNCLHWIKDKKRLLLDNSELKQDLTNILRMEFKMGSWSNDLDSLRNRVEFVHAESKILKEALHDLSSPEMEDRFISSAIRLINLWESDVDALWKDFQALLEEHQKKLDTSLALKNVLQVSKYRIKITKFIMLLINLEIIWN